MAKTKKPPDSSRSSAKKPAKDKVVKEKKNPEKPSKNQVEKPGRKKKQKKKDTSSESSVSSSSKSSSADEDEWRVETEQVAGSMGLNGKKLAINGSKLRIMKNLSAQQVAVMLALSHSSLTEQRVFSLGGELWEIRKRALATLRGANEEQALRLRIQVAQKEALAEQMWKERMMTIVEAGSDMNSMTVISQHESLANLRKNFFSEIERKKEADGKAGQDYDGKLQTLIDECIRNARKEMEDEIRSGVCGKVLGEDELTGTPNKKRSPPQRLEDPDSKRSPSRHAPNVPFAQRKVRLGQSRPGGFNSLDDDLLMGRYSSGPPSSAASSSRGEMSTWTKAISRALEPALSSLVFNENDRVHLIQCMVADGFAGPVQVVQGINDGWTPDRQCCGEQAGDFLGKMSFNGRKQALDLVKAIGNSYELYLEQARGAEDDELSARASRRLFSNSADSRSDEALPLDPDPERKLQEIREERKRLEQQERMVEEQTKRLMSLQQMVPATPAPPAPKAPVTPPRNTPENDRPDVKAVIHALEAKEREKHRPKEEPPKDTKGENVKDPPKDAKPDDANGPPKDTKGENVKDSPQDTKQGEKVKDSPQDTKGEKVPPEDTKDELPKDTKDENAKKGEEVQESAEVEEPPKNKEKETPKDESPTETTRKDDVQTVAVVPQDALVEGLHDNSDED